MFVRKKIGWTKNPSHLIYQEFNATNSFLKREIQRFNSETGNEWLLAHEATLTRGLGERAEKNGTLHHCGDYATSRK